MIGNPRSARAFGSARAFAVADTSHNPHISSISPKLTQFRGMATIIAPRRHLGSHLHLSDCHRTAEELQHG